MQLDRVRRDLTPRHLEIIKLLCLHNKLIAKTLYISRQTVKNHITEINKRLGTEKREQILIKCLKEGKVELEEIYYK